MASLLSPTCHFNEAYDFSFSTAWLKPHPVTRAHAYFHSPAFSQNIRLFNQYSRGVKCLGKGHNAVKVGFEPPTSNSEV